jgi:hypothetical protein
VDSALSIIFVVVTTSHATERSALHFARCFSGPGGCRLAAIARQGLAATAFCAGMVLTELSAKLASALGRLSTRGATIDEKLVKEVVLDVQRALIDADVNTGLVAKVSPSWDAGGQ